MRFEFNVQRVQIHPAEWYTVQMTRDVEKSTRNKKQSAPHVN